MDKQEKLRQKTEKGRIQKFQEDLKAKVEGEPKLSCTFVNLESKGVSLDFVYEGILKYHLEDGKQSKLPLTIIEHINSLKVPVMKYKIDKDTGMLKPETEVKQMLQRFSVTPINLSEYTEVLKELDEGGGD